MTNPNTKEPIRAGRMDIASRVKVVVLNDFSLRSSIGRTVNDYLEVLSRNGLVLSMVYSSRPEGMKYPGTEVHPESRPFSWLEGHLPAAIQTWRNSRRAHESFRSLYESLRRSSRIRVLHYSNNRIRPEVVNEHSAVTMNDLIYVKTKRLSEWIIRRHLVRNTEVYKRFPHVLAVSQATKKELTNYGFEGKITVIHHPVRRHFYPLASKSAIRRELGLPEECRLVLSISTNRPGKNLGAVKGTMALLGHRYRLVRVGSPLGSGVNFPVVNGEQLNKIFNACDVLLMPSTEEGFGMPIPEAFTVGLPVVASDIEVFQEICGSAAKLTEPTPTSLKRSVEEVLADPSPWRSAGIQRSRQFAFSVFSENLTRFYEGILGEPLSQ